MPRETSCLSRQRAPTFGAKFLVTLIVFSLTLLKCHIVSTSQASDRLLQTSVKTQPTLLLLTPAKLSSAKATAHKSNDSSKQIDDSKSNNNPKLLSISTSNLQESPNQALIVHENATTTTPSELIAVVEAPKLTHAVSNQGKNNNEAIATDRPTVLADENNSRLIESVLIQVSRMNLNNEGNMFVRPNRKPNKQLTSTKSPISVNADELESTITTARDDEDDEASMLSNSSQAPTDSGEDLIEAALATSSRSKEPLMTTSASVSATVLSKMAATTTMTPSFTALDTVENTQHKQLVTADADEDLVDGNNVRPLDRLLETARNFTEQAGEQMGFTEIPQAKMPISCEQAYKRCALREVCVPALRSYNEDCQDLINNKTNSCSNKCLKAMIALRSTDEGDNLARCDCQGNEYCIKSKERGEICKPQVEHAIDHKTIVSCATASWICLADQPCSKALEYYYRNCQSLFSQRQCSISCNNSLSILHGQAKASKLINCQCDGSEEFPCIKYKTYTERLCLNKLSHVTLMDDGSSPDLELPHDELPEDDTFNLTNDPETFVLGRWSSNEEDETANSNESADFEDAKPGTPYGDLPLGEESASTTSFNQPSDKLQSSNRNGIPVDNWIPLISSRYFASLNHHQQRAKEQNRQQVRINGGKQRPGQQGSESVPQAANAATTKQRGQNQHSTSGGRTSSLRRDFRYRSSAPKSSAKSLVWDSTMSLPTILVKSIAAISIPAILPFVF